MSKSKKKLSEVQVRNLQRIAEQGSITREIGFGGIDGWGNNKTTVRLYKLGLISMDIDEDFKGTIKLTEEGEAYLDSLNG